MSDLRLDLLSAALRHCRDAEHLLGSSHTSSSPDQAFHLAGFGPECARKAVLSRGTFDKALGHALAPEAALGGALALDPAAHRYRITRWEMRHPALANWTEQARYEKTGQRDAAEASSTVSAARAIFDDIVLALWADGRIPRSFTW